MKRKPKKINLTQFLMSNPFMIKWNQVIPTPYLPKEKINNFWKMWNSKLFMYPNIIICSLWILNNLNGDVSIFAKKLFLKQFIIDKKWHNPWLRMNLSDYLVLAWQENKLFIILTKIINYSVLFPTKLKISTEYRESDLLIWFIIWVKFILWILSKNEKNFYLILIVISNVTNNGSDL